MNAFFGLLSLLIFFVCIIGLIYSVFKKKPKKKWGIGLIVAVIVLFVCVVTDTDKKETTASEQQLITEQQSEPAKELTAEEQKQLILDWYKNYNTIATEFDNGFIPFKECINDLANNNISKEDAINKFDLVYNNMDNIVHKLNDVNPPKGLDEEQTKAINDCILSLQSAAQERRGACMTLRDALKNDTMKESKAEIAIKKIKASDEHILNATTNLVTTLEKAGIDLNTIK